MPYRILLLIFLFAASVASAANVYLGMPIDELEATLGEPTSRSTLGEREILNYPGGVIIRTYEGKVVTVKGMDYDLKPPAQPQEKKSFSLPTLPAETSQQPTATIEPKQPATVQTKPEPVESSQVQEDETEELMREISPEGQLEQVKNLAKKHHMPVASEEETDQSPENEKPLFGGILLFFFANFCIGAIILKIAFTIYGFPLLNRNLIILTAAYGLLMVCTGLIFDAVPFLGMVPYLDVLTTLVLLWACIHHFSDVTQGITSLQIAFIAWFPGAAINMFLL